MVTSWTDEGASSPSARVVINTTAVKAVHINELKTAIDNERARLGRGGAYAWAVDMPVTSNVTTTLTSHITQLRDAANCIGCPTDTPVAPYPGPYVAFTDIPLAANTMNTKAVHINELRTRLNQMESVACWCNCNGYCGCNGQGCGDNSSKRFKKNIKLWV